MPMDHNRVLIVGGDSSIGAAMTAHLTAAGFSTFKTTRRKERVTDETPYLDLETLAGMADLPACQWTVLVASETRFAECERDPEYSGKVNHLAPIEIGRHVGALGSRTLFFSSIAVHDGASECPHEDLEPSPNSLYGRQKRDAETGLMAALSDVVIIRPSKVIIPHFPMFDQWRAEFQAERPITPFKDMMVAPIWLDTLADSCVRLIIKSDVAGIYQLSARRQISYADIAAHIAAAYGYDPELSRPVGAREKLPGGIGWLPQFATLGCARLQAATGVIPPEPEDAIEGYIDGSKE
jgi:dTDP-4-dehydrorhamnose reductase